MKNISTSTGVGRLLRRWQIRFGWPAVYRQLQADSGHPSLSRLYDLVFWVVGKQRHLVSVLLY